MNHREAAEARAAGVRARADRPSQRRAGAERSSSARVSVRLADLEVRQQGSSSLRFDGYASVTGTGYEMYDFFGPYTELVNRGAFESTLARADLDVPFVLQHEDLRRIARTTNGTLHLSEDDGGLRVRADLDPDDLDVQYIVPKLRSGLIDEMSFKFRIDSGEWSPDWDEYHINSVDIHRGDVAIVGYGANPHTKGAGLAPELDQDPVSVLLSATATQAQRQQAIDKLLRSTQTINLPKPVRIEDWEVERRSL